jgi:hypothetical protein
VIIRITLKTRERDLWQRMDPWIRYLIALIVSFHGLVYLLAPLWSLNVSQGWRGRSFLFGGVITGDSLRTLASGLWAIAGIGLVGAGLTIIFAPWIPSLWRPLAISAALVGMLSFAVFWDGQTHLLTDQGVIGMVISLAIVFGAVMFPQAFS